MAAAGIGFRLRLFVLAGYLLPRRGIFRRLFRLLGIAGHVPAGLPLEA